MSQFQTGTERRLRHRSHLGFLARQIFCFYSSAAPRDLPSFPTRRSSDLRHPLRELEAPVRQGDVDALLAVAGDRKSTRLNSSHANISYAVFCLKKKIEDILCHIFKIALSVCLMTFPILAPLMCSLDALLS